MKGFHALLVVLSILLCFVACSNNPTISTDPSSQSTQATTGNTSTASTGTIATTVTTAPTQTTAPTVTTAPAVTTAPTQTTAPAVTTAPTQTTAPAATTAPTQTTVPAATTAPTQTTAPVHTHNYSDATCTKPATCSCGATKGSALGHDYAGATCTNPGTCKTCGAKGTMLPHDYDDATCTKPATCKHCIATKGSALGHDYAGATCTNPAICKTCGAKGPVLPHDYDEATCIKPATCKNCVATKGGPSDHKNVLGECIYCGDPDEDYCPKLYFTGDMSAMTQKKDVREISFEYRSGKQVITGAAKIKVQGTSSLSYEKKNYTINFYKNKDYADKMGVDVGWGAQNEYCLKANWIDKTHARNVVTARLAAEMQAQYGLFEMAPHNGTIDGFPIEVYINGSFHGLYTMNIPKDTWMFGMDEDNPDHIVICGDNWNDPVLFKEIPEDLEDWAVEVGPEDDATLAKVQRLVKFVKESTDEEFKANFDQYLNLDSTLNYYVMLHFAFMNDNYGKNMLLATYDGEVWYPTLYDLDTTWGTHWTGTKLYSYDTSFVWATSGGDTSSLFWERFEKLYKKEIAERYFELRQTVLDVDHVLKAFTDFQDSIPDDVQAQETARWDSEKKPIPGYPITQIEEYLDTYVPRLDQKFRGWLTA